MKDPLISNNQLPITDPLTLSSTPVKTSQFTFNILTFDHPEKTKQFTFSALENTGDYRFIINKLPDGSERHFTTLDPASPFVYTNFDTTTRGITIAIDFNRQAVIARAW